IRPEPRLWLDLTAYQWAALALVPLFAALWARDARAPAEAAADPPSLPAEPSYDRRTVLEAAEGRARREGAAHRRGPPGRVVVLLPPKKGGDLRPRHVLHAESGRDERAAPQHRAGAQDHPRSSGAQGGPSPPAAVGQETVTRRPGPKAQ